MMSAEVCDGKRGRLSAGEERKTRKLLPPKLPQEMVDTVIDHLHDDRQALAAAALVSRSWVSASRYHLFSTLQASNFNVKLLCELLDNPHCTFTSLVKELQLETLHTASSLTRAQPLSGSMDFLVPHLKKFVSIRKLHASGLYVPIDWASLLKATSFTTRITQLWLCSIRLESFKCWMDILRSFPSMVKLRYGDSHGNLDSRWGDATLPSDVDWTLPPSLRELELESYGTCPVQQAWSQHMWLWLLRSQVRLDTIQLKSLVFMPTDADAERTLDPFSKYLRFLGPSLKQLRLAFKDKHSITQFFDHVDMTQTTGIREWNLSDYCLYYNGDTRSLTYHFLTLPKLLSRLPRQRSLSKISFRLLVAPFDPESVEFFNCVDQEDGDAAWNLVDSTLTGPSFPVLEEVIAEVAMDGDHGLDSLNSLKIAEYLESKLPRCKEMGLLHCVDQGDGNKVKNSKVQKELLLADLNYVN